MKLKRLSIHFVHWAGFFLALLGAFEMAYDAPSHPIWSGTFGFPIPHHYLIGFGLDLIGYFLITKDEWTYAIRKIYKFVF